MDVTYQEYDRIIDLALISGRSAFLWGPRQTGKSFYLRKRYPESMRYDFLRSNQYLKFMKEPYRLRQEIEFKQKNGTLRQPIILDEVQKLPALLDEVHSLIEDAGLQFILCGSSARKLKRAHANMLGGRAVRWELKPLTYHEIPDFDLITALSEGLLPSMYGRGYQRELWRAYVKDYLEVEVAAEGASRNLPAFARFLDAAAFSSGELVNCANIARDCGVSAKTVTGYFDVLVDTLLGTMIPPFAEARGRAIISSASKFYFFDVGLAGFLEKRQLASEGTREFGRAFEQFMVMEVLAYRIYRQPDMPVQYWRTRQGAEVDLVLHGGEHAIEIKGTRRVDRSDYRDLMSFCRDYQPKTARVVCLEETPRLDGKILIQPWREFLDELWGGGLKVKG